MACEWFAFRPLPARRCELFAFRPAYKPALMLQGLQPASASGNAWAWAGMGETGLERSGKPRKDSELAGIGNQIGQPIMLVGTNLVTGCCKYPLNRLSLLKIVKNECPPCAATFSNNISISCCCYWLLLVTMPLQISIINLRINIIMLLLLREATILGV